MQDQVETLAPRTTTDMVFDHLHAKIQSLELLPGTRISEAEVASLLGVSRQPVRDAFNRLGNLKLLKVRPQRATQVSGFSLQQIENARFIRLAVELEVLRNACRIWDAACARRLDDNLELQRKAIATGQIERFHQLDYDYHKLLCRLGGHPLAFEKIDLCKQQVERLCVLSLSKDGEDTAILADHENIATALNSKKPDQVEAALRHHLHRLDSVIKTIHQQHSEYFE